MVPITESSFGKTLLGFLVFVGLFLTSFSARSHEIRPAYLQIVETTPLVYEIYWKVPRMGDAVPRIQPVFPEGFTLEVLKDPKQTPDAAIYTYSLRSETSLRGKELFINGLNKTLIDVLVSVSFANGEKTTLMLQADRDRGVIPGETSAFQVIKTYTILGIEHILLGIDHLLFVLALIMITKGKWRILKTITAFTLAHSITLSLAALGYVNFPGPPVEAVIALSIVFLASEIMKNIDGKQTMTSKKPWIVAFTFGLLHGFGFAGALSDIGLPQTEIPLALAFFNIGVELGQIIFVVFMLVVIYLIQLKKDWPPVLKKVPAYAIGSLAAFWMVERIAGFWG
jgi:hydrogenase/urease accessory protein HupE